MKSIGLYEMSFVLRTLMEIEKPSDKITAAIKRLEDEVCWNISGIRRTDCRIIEDQ